MNIFSKGATVDFLLENATTYAQKKEIYALSEADVAAAGNGLISKLYRSAIDKSFIDFDEIPQSKGDITKYSGYADMVQSLNIVDTIARKSNIKIAELETVNKAISNVIALRDVFTKGYSLNKDFLILQYNTIVAACIEATSCIIASFVEFTKRVDAFEFTLVGGRLDHGANAVKNLETFNKTVASGEYSKIAHIVLKTDAAKGLITESAVVITAAVISTIVVLVVMMREIVFRFFYNKMKLSEYLKLQAMFLEMNKSTVESKSSNLSPDKKKKVVKKQAELAAKLMKWSDKLKVENTMAVTKASSELKKDNATMTLDSVKDSGRMDNFELL